jgi:hypothetical protein
VLVADTRSGVIRIEATGCAEEDIGTGFLISPTLVATVDHVVAGATEISLVRDGKTLATGTVIGDDPARDVALVQSSKPLSGNIFKFDSTAPVLGESVAALGYPLGLPLSVSQGSVSGTDRTVPIDGIERGDLVQTDAALNPGNSGGPLLDADTGRVVGLIDLGAVGAQGISFAVSAQVAQPLLDAWEASPQAVPATTCEPTTTTTTSTSSAASSSSSSSSGGASTVSGPLAAVDDYWNDISDGEFADAWSYLAPGVSTESAFVTGEEEVGITSAVFEGYLVSSSATSATVGVSSLQTIDHKYGCRTWSGTYQMVFEENEWLIARADITPSACQ